LTQRSRVFQKLLHRSLKGVAGYADNNGSRAEARSARADANVPMIGRHLRQYLVTASLGRGGMGEVWLARDTTLERDVAIKTLPAGDADADTRKARFFREARAASALNHPNIITIYEINSDQGVDFIAMEHVDGKTLADLLQHGPLPFDQVHRFAQQIAEAVGRAHRAGIVHRDLKPRNIMVTNDGLVKVLDFGLAKITRAGDADNAATQAALTRSGTTVGTLGYMSPEQAIGDAVDARSDVFSFGVILFEMLTGRLPFSGQTMSEVLRQLHFAEPPPVESLRADVPPSLRAAVTKALQKKPDDRFANMSEVAAALREEPSTAARTKPFVAPVPPVPPRAGWRPMRLVLAGLLIVLIAGIGIVAMRGPRPSAAVATTAAPTTAEPSDPPTISLPSKGAPSRPAASQAAPPKPAPSTAAQAVEPATKPSSTSNQAGQQIAATTVDADLASRRAVDLAKLGDHKNALAVVERIARRQDLSGEVLFRMTLVYELAGARNRALMSMARAVRSGYPKAEFDSAPELTTLRTDPRYPRPVDGPPVRPARKLPARRPPPR
jgi:serine/threonine protein kinase